MLCTFEEISDFTSEQRIYESVKYMEFIAVNDYLSPEYTLVSINHPCGKLLFVGAAGGKVHAFLITWSCCHDSFCLQTKQYL
jgi:hypothetical protein